MRNTAFLSLFVLLSAGCTVLPDGVEGYEDRCVQLNAEIIPPTASDPHLGNKNVFACNIELQALVDGTAIPYPDGTMIVKESFREGEDFPWLLATAEKKSGAWEWKEYKRNFANEDFVQILAGQQVCRNCHEDVKSTSDWIFTHYEEE